MNEIALMNPSKETDGKLRWRTDDMRVPFAFYIPKWRVPQPWPKRIVVRISDVLDTTQRSSSTLTGAAGSLERPIVAVVERVCEHPQTVRFAPSGDRKDWEIGEPYIPYDLLPSASVQALRIEVEWDRSEGTWSEK